MARGLVVLSLAALILNMSLAPLSSQEFATDSSGGYLEVVKEGKGRVYPLSASSMPVKNGDRLIYQDDGAVEKGRMGGGRLILFGMPVDINSASATDLEAVSGIGKKTAMNIVAYRERFGEFAALHDLRSVKGIGAKKLQKMKPFLTI